MDETIASSIVLDVDQAVNSFRTVASTDWRNILAAVVNRLCSEELSHVLEIVAFLGRYQSLNSPEGTQVLIVGVEELLSYLHELKQCPPKSGCLLLVYSLLNQLSDIPERYQNRVTELEHSLAFVVPEMAELISHPLSDELISVAALFEQVSYCVLRLLFEAAYTDRCELSNVCDFIEHLPCIDQQIQACLVLHKVMEKDSMRLQGGLMILACCVRKIKRYTDFGRAKYADELRRLKFKLPEGVYAIVWNYASIFAGQFMACDDSFEQIGDVKCKTVRWLETATHQAKHEFITADRGFSFSIRNTNSGLFLTDIEDNFCYVEKTTDTWRVEVTRRDDAYFYKLTNCRTGNSIHPSQAIQPVSDEQEDVFKLMEACERSLMVVQKFELDSRNERCVIV